MKRMTLIAIALCLLMLTTVGAGVVMAKRELSRLLLFIFFIAALTALTFADDHMYGIQYP